MSSMAPVLFTLAADLVEERDPLWEAVLASPVVDDDLAEDERAALEEGLADKRVGRIVSRNHVLATIERMQHEQGE